MIHRCLTCDTDFEKIGYRRYKFCSKKCSRNRPGGMAPRTQVRFVVKHVCKHCNCEFEAVHVPGRPRKYCSHSCTAKATNRSYMRSEAYHNACVRNPNLNEYSKYRNKVHRLTKETYRLYEQQINPLKLPRTLCGVEGGYQLDHIISIKYGFEHNIPPEELSKKDNLQMLPWKVNLQKGKM
jgi:hypothetical protein